jgi:hypothetical protein
MRHIMRLKDEVTQTQTGAGAGGIANLGKLVGTKVELKLSVHVGSAECCMEMKNYSRAEADFDKAAQIARQAADMAATATAGCDGGDANSSIADRPSKLRQMAETLQGMAKQAWVMHMRTEKDQDQDQDQEQTQDQQQEAT